MVLILIFIVLNASCDIQPDYGLASYSLWNSEDNINLNESYQVAAVCKKYLIFYSVCSTLLEELIVVYILNKNKMISILSPNFSLKCWWYFKFVWYQSQPITYVCLIWAFIDLAKSRLFEKTVQKFVLPFTWWSPKEFYSLNDFMWYENDLSKKLMGATFNELSREIPNELSFPYTYHRENSDCFRRDWQKYSKLYLIASDGSHTPFFDSEVSFSVFKSSITQWKKHLQKVLPFCGLCKTIQKLPLNRLQKYKIFHFTHQTTFLHGTSILNKHLQTMRISRNSLCNKCGEEGP